MDQPRIEARLKRLHAQAQPKPLTPRGDWRGRCTRCGETVSGTVQEIIAKHKKCQPPRSAGMFKRFWLWLFGAR